MQTIPIFPDVTATKKDYVGIPEGHLSVIKTFLTLQGEGPYAGRRALFIRLAGCNFGGKGVNGPGCLFCDTEFNLMKGMPMSVDMLSREIHSQLDSLGISWHDPLLIVITGGEPLLQPNLPSVCRALVSEFGLSIQIQIESNGTMLAAKQLPESVYLVVSPKVPEVRGKDIKKYAIPHKDVLARANCLKVLVSADPDSPYHVIPTFASSYAESGRPVYLSPINVYRKEPKVGNDSIFDTEVFDQKACAMNHAYAAELCIQMGYRLSVQSHLFCAIP